MARSNSFVVAMGDVFPLGAFIVSEVEAVRDFDKSAPGRPVQQMDKESGLPGGRCRCWMPTRSAAE
ncbi:hypothetical protein [Pseudonocardia sp. ICBG601]|uniref:hypothetical protein n=1 Tax=Pseudonocardia sp. ICBG601 TaxID=2846759 RepID=UPI001CF6A896|nr:hypothetical protein [Pseudonocardia sp. ICBG601]